MFIHPKRFTIAAILCGLTISNAFALDFDFSTEVHVKPLLKSSSTWDNTALHYPEGTAEVTAMQIVIAVGGQTGWHSHSAPSFGVLMQGEIEVMLRDGRSKRLKTGDVIAEVVNTEHNGRNIGPVPVIITVFYAGTVGQTLTRKAEDTPAANLQKTD